MQISGTQSHSYQTFRTSSSRGENPLLKELEQKGFSKEELSKLSEVLSQQRRSSASSASPEQMKTQLTDALRKQGFTDSQVDTVLSTLEQNQGKRGPNPEARMKSQLTEALQGKGFSEDQIDAVLETLKENRSKGLRAPGTPSEGESQLKEGLSQKGFSEEQISTVLSALQKQQPPFSLPQDMNTLATLNQTAN